MLADHSRRPHARIQIRRGYDPQSAQKLSLARYLRSGQEIWSGMVMSLSTDGSDVTNRAEFVRGAPATAQKPVIYFALTDFFDSSVEASQKIVGLSCLGDYLIETPWFDDQASYEPEGTPLTWDGDTGKITATTWDDAEDHIIGVTSQDLESEDNPIDRTGEYSEAEPPVMMLRFTTVFLPNRNEPPSP